MGLASGRVAWRRHGVGISSDSVSSVSDMAEELDMAGGLWDALAGLAAFGAGAQG